MPCPSIISTLFENSNLVPILIQKREAQLESCPPAFSVLERVLTLLLQCPHPLACLFVVCAAFDILHAQLGRNRTAIVIFDDGVADINRVAVANPLEVRGLLERDCLQRIDAIVVSVVLH